jgi:hypothetical protein
MFACPIRNGRHSILLWSPWNFILSKKEPNLGLDAHPKPVNVENQLLVTDEPVEVQGFKKTTDYDNPWNIPQINNNKPKYLNM